MERNRQSALRKDTMKSNYAPEVAASSVKYATEEVEGLKIAYREAGKPGTPKLVLLHGFPSSSHQYRNLIPALADRFHVISPDYPGFGNSDAPDPRDFAYTFDQLAEITGKFLRQKGFDHFGLFVQDYGGPVGFRIVTKSPGVLEWLIVQNTNAYEVGFTAAWGGLRDTLWHNRTPENEEAVAGLLAYDTVKAIYLHGAQKPELISPDNWHSDFFTTIQKPNGRQIQLDLFYDYRTNVALYPKWQSFLKQNQPKTIIFWGQDDIFFTREGGEAYLEVLPKAEMHRLESGHFAVEDCLEYIARHMRQFYDQSVT
jgi:pimeloyl-ACP methyl ester carboxylesterase